MPVTALFCYKVSLTPKLNKRHLDMCCTFVVLHHLRGM